MNFRALQQVKLKLLLLGYFLLLMAGCGGGGGSSNGSSSSSAPPLPITVTPSSVTVTAMEGRSTAFDLTLVLSSQVEPSTAHIFFADLDDAITSQVDIVSSDGARTVTLRFHTTPSLSVDTHEGNLNFTVCSTSPCSTPYSSIPANVHYKITVTPAPPAATLAPATINMTATQGYPASVMLDAAVPSDISVGGFGLVDPQNKLSFTVSYSIKSAGVDTLTLSLDTTNVVPGVYTGTASLQVCGTYQCIGQDSVPGSPIDVPYTITVNPAPSAVMLNPAAINITVEQGDPATTDLDATIASGLYVDGFSVVDPQGRFASDVSYIYTSTNVDKITLNLLPMTDVPGTYTGNISLQVCGSYGCTSNDNLPGSPISVPYSITVTPFVPLTAIPTATGLPDWETFQGNAGHTGYVPVTLNSATFVPFWTWKASGSPSLSPVTTGSGKVLLSTYGYFASASVIALNESDGKISWHYDFSDNPFTLDDPAVFGGRVFVATTASDQGTFMYSFDVNDGSLKFKSPFTAQWEHYLAPTIKNNYVYTDGGTYGGMYAFKATSGANKWFANQNQYDLWTPAVDDKYAYAYTGYQFSAVDVATGDIAFTVADNAFNWWGYSLNISPVLPGDGSILVVNGIFNFGYAHANSLISYSISGQNESWRVDGNFASNPVVASGNIYLLDATGNQLEARDETNGTVLWIWQPSDANETMPTGNLVLTNNLVFLTTSAATYAIDLTTHQAVWSTPHIGALALSANKVLYISSQSDYSVYAYQLN